MLTSNSGANHENVADELKVVSVVNLSTPLRSKHSHGAAEPTQTKTSFREKNIRIIFVSIKGTKSYRNVRGNLMLVIPHIKGISEKFRRIANRYNTYYILKPQNKLQETCDLLRREVLHSIFVELRIAYQRNSFGRLNLVQTKPRMEPKSP